MRIERGHYVPKELITSEAIHEAVVKCFVAAGFKAMKEKWHGFNEANKGIGLAVDDDEIIAWLSVADNPLTLQQLFTAENGLQWPEWAESVNLYGPNCVAFYGKGSVAAISGSVIEVERNNALVLATRQPKEKEVNEFYNEMSEALKTLDKRIIEDWSGVFKYEGYSIGNINFSGDFIKQRAKELGFIGKYRWGVEYPTNGKRPELADDVVVTVHKMPTDETMKEIVAHWNWCRMDCFKITDQRYKPADTSYLQTPAAEPVEEVANGDWWDGVSFPPIGVEFEITFPDDTDPKWELAVVLFSSEQITIISFSGFEQSFKTSGLKEVCKFRPLDHATRKAELEKKRVVDAALKFTGLAIDIEDNLKRLYDAGCLRLPE